MAGAAKKNPALKRNQRKPGQPTKYRPEMCDKVIKAGKAGKSITAMANACGVHRETIYAWMETHPAFSDAINLARQYALEWWETSGQGQTRGRYEGANATSMIFMMKNQFPDDYRDRREIDHSGELKIVEVDFTGYEEDPDDEG